MRSSALVIVAGLLAVTAMADTGAQPRIAIIIDDLGYQLDAGRRAIALPGPLAYAVLPATPRGRQLAEAAHRSGKEVLLISAVTGQGLNTLTRAIARLLQEQAVS